VYAYEVTTGHCPAGTTEKVTCWPMPEVPNNIDMTLGNLGLTEREENQIVAFLETLIDGYTTPYPDRSAFTGRCLQGGSAATRGIRRSCPRRRRFRDAHRQFAASDPCLDRALFYTA
jgi:cytochrome c peroxidase